MSSGNGRSFSRRKVTFLLVSSSLVMFCISGILGARVLPKVSRDDTYRYLSLFDEVLSLVRYNYVEPVDGGRLMTGAYKGAAESLDPYGAYLSPEEMKSEQERRKVAGGVVGLTVSKRFGYIVVISTTEASPAASASIESGDYIITVDGVSSSDLSIAGAMEMFHGPVGSTLKLSVIRRSSRTGEPEDIDLVRAESSRNPVSASVRDEVLVLKIRELGPEAVATVRSEAAAHSSMPLLLDLRDCANDSLTDAVALADLFLDEGPIVKIKSRKHGDRSLDATPAPDTIAAPAFVLVNRGSAGASELVACALKFYKRALVLGERTFGRGSEQEVLPLSNGGGLRVSVAKYLSPDDTVIQGSGVEPDREIAAKDDEGTAAPAAGDAVLDEALELAREKHDAQPAAA